MLRLSMTAAVLSAGILSSHIMPAAALPGSSPPAIEPALASNVQLADWNGRHRRWVYNRRAHGPRFAYRHGAYRYYHGGYWYARPWWGGPGVAVTVAPGVVDPAYFYGGEPVYGAPDLQHPMPIMPGRATIK